MKNFEEIFQISDFGENEGIVKETNIVDIDYKNLLVVCNEEGEINRICYDTEGKQFSKILKNKGKKIKKINSLGNEKILAIKASKTTNDCFYITDSQDLVHVNIETGESLKLLENMRVKFLGRILKFFGNNFYLAYSDNTIIWFPLYSNSNFSFKKIVLRDPKACIVDFCLSKNAKNTYILSKTGVISIIRAGNGEAKTHKVIRLRGILSIKRR